MNVLYFNLFSSNLMSLGKPVVLEFLRQGHKVRIVNVDPYVTQADRTQLLKAGVPREEGRQPFIQHFHMEPFQHHLGLVDVQRKPMKKLLEWANIVFCPREGGHTHDVLMHDVYDLFRGHSAENKTFVLQHGLIHQDAIDNHVYFPFQSDWLITWSQAYRRLLSSKGMAEKDYQRTVAMGCPKFDQLINMDKDPQYILVTPNTHWDRYSEEANKDFFCSLDQACDAFRSEQIVVKTHPAERHFNLLGPYEELAQRHKNLTLVVDNVSIPDLLAKAKALIHTCSTVAIEAAIADVPVVTWNYTGITTGMDDFDATYCVDEVFEVIPTLEQVLTHPKEKRAERLQLAEHHNGVCDGQATQRVVEFMFTSEPTVSRSSLYQAMYDEYWSNWHRDVSSFTNELFTRKITEIFQPVSLLDVGCGPGENLRMFIDLGVDAYGVEYSRWMVENKLQDLKEIGRVTQGSITDLSVFDSAIHSFEIVFCIEVLEHLPPDDIDLAISELVRAADDYIICTIAFSPSAALDGPEANIKREMFADLDIHATVQPPEWWLKKFERAGAVHDPILSRALAYNEERFGNTQLFVFCTRVPT